MTSALSAELSKQIRRGDLDMAILKETESDEPAGPERNRKWLVDEHGDLPQTRIAAKDRQDPKSQVTTDLLKIGPKVEM